MIKQWIAGIAVMFVALWSAQALAAQGPYEVVKATTDKVMVIVIDAQKQGTVQQDPEKFYGDVEQAMDAAVDFPSFARGVMGKFGDKRYYDTLKSEEEKKAFLERISRFTEQFKTGLINTYAKGLLAFDGNRIEVLPLEQGDAADGSAVVTQHIYGDRPQPYSIKYLMRDNGQGEWKVRNVLIEGIDLGRTYRGQFNASLYRYKGDVDQVVDNWSVAVTPGA